MRFEERRGQEHGVGDWQAVHTRAICTTITGGRESNRVVPILVSTSELTERKRTYAVRALGQWCARKRRLVLRLLSRYELMAGFSSREKQDANTLKNALKSAPVAMR